MRISFVLETALLVCWVVLNVKNSFQLCTVTVLQYDHKLMHKYKKQNKNKMHKYNFYNWKWIENKLSNDIVLDNCIKQATGVPTYKSLRRRLLRCFFSTFALAEIWFHIKIIEKPKEQRWLRQGKVHPENGIIALEYHHQKTVETVEHKLPKLQNGNVLFPPKVLLHVWS